MGSKTDIERSREVFREASGHKEEALVSGVLPHVNQGPRGRLATPEVFANPGRPKRDAKGVLLGLVHAAHSTTRHAATRHRRFVLRLLHHDSLGGQQEAGDRRSVLEG